MGFVLKSLEVEGEHADHLTYTTAPSVLQLLWNLFMSYCSSLKQKKRSICPPSNVGFQSNFLSHSEWKLVGWRKWKINQSTVLFAHNEAASVISQSCIDNTRYICEGGGASRQPTYLFSCHFLISLPFWQNMFATIQQFSSSVTRLGKFLIAILTRLPT